MKILYVGFFTVQWSADYPRAMGLKRQEKNNKIVCFDYRYKEKQRSVLYEKTNLNQNSKNYSIRSNHLIFNLKYFLKKRLLSIKEKNSPSFNNLINRFNYYFFGNWKINRQLLREVKNNNYNFVFLSKTNTINYKLISKINKYTKTWYFFMDPLSIALEMNANKYASLSTWSSATFSSVNSFFKREGANSYFITEGYDSSIFKPSENGSAKEIDVIFIGSISPKREKYIKFLTMNKINVVCYGTGWKNNSIYLKDLVNKYKISKIILNFTRGKIGFSDRVLLAMGTGSFLLSEYCQDLKKFFKKGIHLDWFENSKELLELVNYYLENHMIREMIAHQGYLYVKKNFTWEKIMDKIIQIIKK